MLKIGKKQPLTLPSRAPALSKPQRRKRPVTLSIAATFLLLLIGLNILDVLHSRRQAPTATTAPAVQTTAEAPAPQPAEQTVSDMFSTSNDSLYDKATNTYSFSANDYDSLFKNTNLSDQGSGLKSGSITRGGQTWNIYCYSSLNSCSVSTSSGTYGNVSCYNSTHSCSYSDSSGNYANTYCSQYTSSCSTTGSNGYSSNTYCYQYTNSCSTTDSTGGYSNTYCYQYTNSCSTSNSDGSTTNTYCYSSSCSSSTYGGSSSYDSYSNNYY